MRPPPLVVRAGEAATGVAGDQAAGEGGALLHVLAAGRSVTRAAEIGAVSAVATAWIASALRPGVPLFTVAAEAVAAPRATIVIEVGGEADDEPHSAREAWFDHVWIDAIRVRTGATAAIVAVARS